MPGQSTIATGDINVFVIAAPGQNVALNTLRGFGSFFQPANLTNLGGVAIYNTVSAPTQPPTIPVNSLWFTPAGGIEQWNGSAWAPVSFSGQQIISAASIFTAQLGAGIIYAGIVDGTLIRGATVRVVNAFGATIMTINKTAATWIQYLDTGSAAQGIPIASSALANFTDEFNNQLLAGTVTYANISGTIYAVQNFQGNINFLNATNFASPWNIYASLEPDQATGALAYFDDAGNKYFIGHKAFRNNAVPVTINSTIGASVLSITGLLPTGQGYHIQGHVLYIGNQAAGAPIFSWTGSSGLALGTQQNGFQRFSGGGVAPIIHNNNGALGAVTGPAFAASSTNWLYEFDIYVTVVTGGTLAVVAQENTAGDSFVINQSYATIEPY
jgi:hypothetical protein